MKIRKDKSQDKIQRVMSEFKNGTLKDSLGNIITDHRSAVAKALSEAGVSYKELKKAELINKLKVEKSKIENMIKKEELKDKSIDSEIIKFFKNNPNPTDKSGVHALAENLGVDPSVVEEKIYSILSSLINGGKSKGEEKPVDKKEYDMGMEAEKEHSDNEFLRKKIVLDHLAEDKSYYSKLKQVEG
jgi:hypothetical protein